MTPLLVLLVGFHPATAVGTALLYASLTKSVGTVVHHKGQTVDWKIVGGLSTGSLPAATVTLIIMSRMGANATHSPLILNLLLGGALLLTSFAVFFRPWILRWAGDHIHGMADRHVTGWSVPGRSADAPTFCSNTARPFSIVSA